MNSLDGKVAIVTGASRGIGAATASEIVAAGGKVVIADILEEQGAALAAILGEAAIFIRLDVTSMDDWAAAASLAVRHFGRLDILVNNAGVVSSMAPVDAIARDEWDRVLAINLTGVFNGIQACVPAMKAAGAGSIVNVSSVAGIRAVSGLAAYSASKAAVRGLTKAAALDLGMHRIRVNSIHPGLIETDMTTGLEFPVGHLALARAGQPAEVAGLAVYLASDSASFCTGGEFVCDGGDTAGTVLPGWSLANLA